MFVTRPGAKQKYKILRMDDTTTVLQNRYGAEFDEPIKTLIACGYILILEEGEVLPLEWPSEEFTQVETVSRDADCAETVTEESQKTQNAGVDTDSASLRHQDTQEQQVSGNGESAQVQPTPEPVAPGQPVAPEPENPEPVNAPGMDGLVNLFDF